MVTGAVVNLKVDGPSLMVENGQGEYLGTVEPKRGQRLIKLMDGGNTYSAAIVSSTEEAVTVIIRETYQDPSQAGRLSFPTREVEAHWPHVGDRIIRRGLEYEESLTGEPSYTVIGAEEGEDTEIFLEESSEAEEEEAEG
jgi:hypothetical protein